MNAVRNYARFSACAVINSVPSSPGFASKYFFSILAAENMNCQKHKSKAIDCFSRKHFRRMPDSETGKRSPVISENPLSGKKRRIFSVVVDLYPAQCI
jgi:hypothetical protein